MTIGQFVQYSKLFARLNNVNNSNNCGIAAAAARRFSKSHLSVCPKQQAYKESSSYFKNTFINSARAADDFLLCEKDLRNVLTYKRRSPYLDKEPINVYNIHEVRKVAQKKYGTLKRMTEIRENAEDEIRRHHVIMKHLRRALTLPGETIDETSHHSFYDRIRLFFKSSKKQGFHIIATAVL
ncbi:MAG: hypothetical protein MHMPM18_004604, partial [Marteilia pararefringens]